jgi:hypothetical protein
MESKEKKMKKRRPDEFHPSSFRLHPSTKRVIDGARTRDIQDHNLALYQLSYDHRMERFILVFAAGGVKTVLRRRIKACLDATSRLTSEARRAYVWHAIVVSANPWTNRTDCLSAADCEVSDPHVAI